MTHDYYLKLHYLWKISMPVEDNFDRNIYNRNTTRAQEEKAMRRKYGPSKFNGDRNPFIYFQSLSNDFTSEFQFESPILKPETLINVVVIGGTADYNEYFFLSFIHLIAL